MENPQNQNNKPNKKAFVLICLGNWGENYKYTRHNFGFLLADHICQKLSERFISIQFGEYLHTNKLKEELYVFKGKTFMNLSGETAKKFLDLLMRKNPESKLETLICHDDLDIPFGRIKIYRNGGSGGHNGVKSIIENIGKENIRIRLGIGEQKNVRKTDTVDYVLSKFSKNEMEKIPRILEAAYQAVETIINESVEKAMSVFNSLII
ncbi:MAG: aminoacyl-tRNA hydrolase [Candidatus Calescibacterium sp.]|nr:aminoacyl-tRNA hydrolase [Candidatus Calescibacterium sp.]MCX7733927.1 aminoacyl-tRNA hydrolase [bacterium]MDW8086475.1 aminoacyl-tRNA hydrolase [Candidatus Calescibacterium sp.]